MLQKSEPLSPLFMFDKVMTQRFIHLLSHKSFVDAVYQLPSESYLTDSNGVVQYCLGIGGVVTAGQLGVAEVGLEEQVSLGVGAVIRVGVDLQWELLSQLAVQLVFIVSDRQFGILLCILRDRDQK